MQNDKNFRPDRIGAYFHIEWLPLALVTVSGLIYNIGLLATPWFEGRLAQCLTDIFGRQRHRRGHGHTGADLCAGYAGGAGGAVHQALLRAPLCQ